MNISYCTVCHNRLDQLKQTLQHNAPLIELSVSELCILAYNDESVEPYVRANYPYHIADGRIKVKTHNDDYVSASGEFAYGYVKNLAHAMGRGTVLFNLDTDNFITPQLHQELLNLKPRCIITPSLSRTCDSSLRGYLAIHSTDFKRLRGYRDIGKGEDLDLINRARRFGVYVKRIHYYIDPIPNTSEG